jgi:hypothetical protein
MAVMPRPTCRIAVAFLAVSSLAAAGEIKPPAEPAKMALSLSPEAVAPGGTAKVTLRLSPIAGVRINRYPQVRLQVAAREGIVGAAEAAVGSERPLPPEAGGSKYFETVDPVVLDLAIDPRAPKGRHEIPGKLVYYYCVGESFCAPARVAVEIPVTVR